MSITATEENNTSLALEFNVVKIGIAVTQPSETELSGSITVYPASGFTYSIDGETYQESNIFTGLGVGLYSVTIKDNDGNISPPATAIISVSDIISTQHYQVKATHLACPGTNDGKIDVKLAKAYPYTVTVKGAGIDKTEKFNGASYTVNGLAAGSYTLCFTIDGLAGYQQCFAVTLTQPQDLSVYAVKSANSRRAVYAVSGGERYRVTHNGTTRLSESSMVEIALKPGRNSIRITTENECQGIFEEEVYFTDTDKLILFPNPTKGELNVIIPQTETAVTIELISFAGNVALKKQAAVSRNGTVQINLHGLPAGVYIVKVSGKSGVMVGKVIKE